MRNIRRCALFLFARYLRSWRVVMDKDRVKGSATNMGGKVKEMAGKATGDQKLKGEGAMDQAKGKVQNAVGGIKDAIKGKS